MKLDAEQQAEVRRIAHEVIQEHIEHPAPHGHKGLEQVMEAVKRHHKEHKVINGAVKAHFGV